MFERHIRFDNPRGYDYNRHPYGNDVGFLSELAQEGGGVELLGERLVTLVDSSSSMTRRGTREHIWQMRWQYTFNFLRVWTWWDERGVPGRRRLVRLGAAPAGALLADARRRRRAPQAVELRRFGAGVRWSSAASTTRSRAEASTTTGGSSSGPAGSGVSRPRQLPDRVTCAVESERGSSRARHAVSAARRALTPVMDFGDQCIAGAFADPHGERVGRAEVPAAARAL